ncbi:MAG: hypothetical protein A3B37_03525 [Candidatus Sungbacteria bacterium RIFCSPLOWO2_01_FULL_59_16]|uniref:Bacterial repeat domain-containing protein n=1 Tax=Candidatus Sungbacteria bacterium RIFCSPLOWO2_01_FULL_59_16 TaxID=1802280 RepID=A0A1G2LC96_9BACT|nr:MAG: hypothetical protein A3B37_03525 [Candidatus Sungbacteria bacterium RIFCSPLOWO2_01_FULL_59_16]
MTNSGTIQCNGSCSASTPDDSLCSSNQAPVAVATISKDGTTYADSITVTQGVVTPIYLLASGSSDPNGWTDPTNGVSSGGKCDWNSDLNQGTPIYETVINNPASPSSCNIQLDANPATPEIDPPKFDDAPGTYTYSVLRITDRQGAASNVDTVSVTVQAAPQTLSVSKAGSGSGTVTSSPAGINCGADCSETYSYGTAVTLTASPSAGSTFAGWLGDCSGIGSCNVTMTAARSVTATFNSIPPATGDMRVKRVGRDDTTATVAGLGTKARVDSLAETTQNPADFINLSVGDHGVSATNVSGYSEFAAHCFYDPLSEPECSTIGLLPPAVPPPSALVSCSGGWCTVTKPVQGGKITKTVFKYLAFCEDGLDNDGDGKIDFSGGDPGCTGPSDTSEANTPIFIEVPPE